VTFVPWQSQAQQLLAGYYWEPLFCGSAEKYVRVPPLGWPPRLVSIGSPAPAAVNWRLRVAPSLAKFPYVIADVAEQEIIQ